MGLRMGGVQVHTIVEATCYIDTAPTVGGQTVRSVEARSARRATHQLRTHVQVVDVVDSLAYDTHDTDDALGLGFITLDDLAGVEFWQRAAGRVRGHTPGLSGNPFRTAVVRELLAWQVTDLLDETARRVADLRSVAEVRAATGPLVGFSADVRTLKAGLERFLRERVYRHHRVLRMTANGKRILTALFHEYVRHPELLPEKHLRRWAGADGVIGPPPPAWVTANRQPLTGLERVVGDYLAGMTDRYCIRVFEELTVPESFAA